MSLGTLSIDLEARLAKFEAGMGRAEHLLRKLNATAADSSRRIGEVFAGSLFAGAAQEGLSRLVGYFPQVVEGVLAIKDAAEATGASVENISALDDIARRAGASLADVEGVLIKFNAALKEADGKNGISRALEAIGLNAAELRSVDPAQALLQTAQALERFDDDGNKARLTQELFGKGVKNAATFLRDLAEAGSLAGSVTAAQAEEVDKFSKQLSALNANAGDVARTLMMQVVPAVNEFYDAFRGKGAGTLDSMLTEPMRVAAVLGANVAFVLKGIGTEIGGIAAQASAFFSGNFAGAAEIGRAMRADAAAARKEFDLLERRLMQAGTVPTLGDDNELARRFGARGARPSVGAVGARVEDPARLKASARAWDDYSQALTLGLSSLIGQTDTVKFAEINAQLDRLQQLAAAGLDPAIVEQVRALLVPPAGDKMGPPLSDELARINDLLKQTDSARLASLRQDMAMLITEMERTDESTERWYLLRDALAAVQAKINDLNLGAAKFTDETAKQLEGLRNTVQGALGDSISRAMRGEIDSIGEMWANLLVEMTSRAIATDLMDALFGKSGGGGGSLKLIDAIVGLFGFTKSANGNAFDQSGLIAFANGGIVDRATPFSFGGGRAGVMGEAGPEAILPLKRGGDGKLGVMSRGGGVVINQTINVQAGASRNEVMQAAAAAKNAAVSEIIDLQRRGRIQ